MGLDNSSDHELLSLLNKGDRNAFAEIYERYWSLLLRHAIGMLNDEDDAQDVVQDIFQLLWEKRTELTIHTSLSSFLYTSTRHRILDRFKHHKVADRFLSTLQSEIEAATSSTDDTIEEKEFVKKFEEGLKQLPPKMRQVFELSRIHEYSYREIAKELDLSENTVKKQISNALKIMRKGLNRGLFFFF
ncbi:MAG: RNA polymerase sigma-70 factor [Bacteroidota bacterium]